MYLALFNLDQLRLRQVDFENITLMQILKLAEYFLYGAIIILGSLLILGLLSSLWLSYRRERFRQKAQFVTFAIDVPGEEIKSPKAAENIIAQLYAIKSKFNIVRKWWYGEYTLQASLDIIGQDGYVQFVVRVPRKYELLIQKAIFAQYPDADIVEIQDYTDDINVKDLISENPETGTYDIWGTEFVMTRPCFYPIRTYPLFVDASGREFSDPLGAAFEMMSHLKRGERFWYQITIAPTRKPWQDAGVKEIKTLVAGQKKKKKGNFILTPIASIFTGILSAFFEGVAGGPSKKEEKKKQAQVDSERGVTLVPPEQDLIVKAIREKISRLGFSTYIRAMYIAHKDVFDKRQATGDFQGIMRQFFNPQMNSIVSSKYIEVDYQEFWFPKLREKWRKKRLLRRAKRRYAGVSVDEPGIANFFAMEHVRNILSIEELATLWHFPQSEEGKSIGLVRRVLSKKVHPNQILPESETIQPASQKESNRLELDPNITFFAQTNYRKMNRQFGIRRDDRRRHMYLIGKTGMGKTTLLLNMIYQDIMRGEGVAVIDPHGDLADKILDFVPPNRINDTIYFNPADQEYPIAFNILSPEETNTRYLIASSLVGIFKKIWADSWGPRLEYLLRNSLLTLLETEDNTILGVPRLFVDTEYRKKVINQVADPVVRSFWTMEYAKYNQAFQVEAISPIQNKIGQVKSKLNFREILDGKKIFLVNLAKGLIGEDVSSLLGATIISKLQIAAMMRADVVEEERPDFYLYIDEFQNFSTDSFATILSEARKYHLNLMMAHQYIEQLDELVAAAVFGNVGTFISFAIGAEDAVALEQQFVPEFIPQDLVNLGRHEIVLRLMINGATSRPFSAQTLAPVQVGGISSRSKIIQVSRERYSVSRDIVEEKLERWLLGGQTRPSLGAQNLGGNYPPPRIKNADGREKPKEERRNFLVQRELPNHIKVGGGMHVPKRMFDKQRPIQPPKTKVSNPNRQSQDKSHIF